MKLHLPNGLRKAVMACMAAVATLTTTVGTGIITGGAVTYMLAAVPQAHAAYEWKTNSSGDTPLTIEDWDNENNWTLTDDSSWELNDPNASAADIAASRLNGPGTVKSGKWNPIIIDGGEAGVTFGESHLNENAIDLDGWQLNITLRNNVTLNAKLGKMQGDLIKVENNSHLNVSYGDGNYNNSDKQIVVGKDSSLLIDGISGVGWNDRSTLVCLTDSTARITLKGENNIQLGNNTKIEAVVTGENDTLAKYENIVFEGARFGNITSFNSLLKSDVELTAENAATHKGNFWVAENGTIYYVNTDGAYDVWGEINVNYTDENTHGYNVRNGAKLKINNGNGGAGSAEPGQSYGYGDIELEGAGSTLVLHMAGGVDSSIKTVSETDKYIVDSAISLGEGSKVSIEDGSYYFSRPITVLGSAQIETTWSKGTVFSAINGNDADAILTVRGPEKEGYENSFSFNGAGEFNGTVQLQKGPGNATTFFILNHAQALQNAKIDVGAEGDKLILALNVAESTVRALTGNAKIALVPETIDGQTVGKNVGVTAAELTITAASGDFGGKLASDITLNITGGTQGITGGSYDGYVKVGTNGALNVSGNITLAHAVENAGKVDVSGVTGLVLGSAITDAGVTTDKVTTYTVINGGTVTGLETYTSDQLKSAISFEDYIVTTSKEFKFKDGLLILESFVDDLTWSGGNLKLGNEPKGDKLDDGGVFNNEDAITFQSSDASVSLVSDVLISELTVNSNISVDIDGEHQLEIKGAEIEGNLNIDSTTNVVAEHITVGESQITATLAINGTGHNLGTVDGLGTLIIAPGKLATLEEAIGADTSIQCANVTISGEGTELSAIGDKFNNVNVTVTDKAILNADGVSWGQADKVITIADSATLKRTSGDDMLYYNNKQDLYILAGGTWDLGSTRATMDNEDIIHLNNGFITGTCTDYRGALDFYEGGCTFNASNGSVISAAIGTQNSSVPLIFNVTEDAKDGTAGLTISGVIKNAASVEKIGNGTLILSAENTYSGTTLVKEGTLTIAAANYTVDLSKLTVAEGATLKLATTGAATHAGTVTVGGNLTLAGALNITGLDAATETYTDTKDGYLTVTYTVAEAGGAITTETGAAATVNGVAPTALNVVDGKKLVATVEDNSIFHVNSANYAYDATKVSTNHTGFHISETGELVISSTGATLGAVTIDEGGKLVINNAEDATLADLIGSGTNITGVVEFKGSGEVLVNSGMDTNNNHIKNPGINNADIIIDGGSLRVNVDGNKHASLAGDITILNSGVITLEESDSVDPNSAQTITIDGASMVSNCRTEFGTGDQIILKNGTMSGTGDDYGAYDFSATQTVEVSGTSTISGTVRIRDNQALTINIAEESNLTFAGIKRKSNDTNGSGTLTLKGKGTAVLQGSVTYNDNGDPTINTAYLTNLAAATVEVKTLKLGDYSSLGYNTVNIATGSTLMLGSAANNSADATLNMAGGATLALSALHTDAASLTLKALTLDGDGGVKVDLTTVDSLAAGEYKLLDVTTGVDASAASKFSLDDSVLGMYNGTFSVAENVLKLTLTAKDNAVIWTGSTEDNVWNGTNTNTPWVGVGSDAEKAFADGDYVNFTPDAAEGERTVTIKDTVAPAAISVTGTDWEWTGAGSINCTGALTVGDGTETELTIANTGTMTFTGGVTVNEGATLVVKNVKGWTEDTGKVSGAGTLELNGIGTGGKYSHEDILKILDSATGSLETLKLTGGSIIHQMSGTKADENKVVIAYDWLYAVSTLEITAGSSLVWNPKGDSSDAKFNSADLTIKIAGSGSVDMPANQWGGALNFFTYVDYLDTGSKSATITFGTLELTDDATINVGKGGSDGAHSITLAANITSNNHTLTKVGGGTLQLDKAFTDDFNLDIKAGMVYLNGSNAAGITAEGKVKLSGSGCLAMNNPIVSIQELNVTEAGTLQVDRVIDDGKVVIESVTGSGTITLTRDKDQDRGSINDFELSGSNTFSGDWVLDRHVALKVTNTEALANATVSLDFVQANNAANKATLRLHCETVKLKGLQGSIGTVDAEAVTSCELQFNTAGGDYSYGGNFNVSNKVNIVKNGAGSQSFTNADIAFSGNITVNEGTLNITKAQSSAGREISIAAGATLGTALELNGGSLTLDATGTTAASLGDKALTLGQGTTLALTVAGTEVTGTQLTLLGGISSLAVTADVTAREDGLLGTLGEFFTLGTITDKSLTADTPAVADATGADSAWADRLGRSELFYDATNRVLYLELAANILAADPLFWETANGNGDWSDPSWSEQNADAPEPPAVDPGTMAGIADGKVTFDGEVIFDGDTGAKVGVDVAATVKKLTVKDGSYTFANDGGSLTVTDTLTVGADGVADISALGSVSVGSLNIAGADTTTDPAKAAGELTADILLVKKNADVAGTLKAKKLAGDGKAEITGGTLTIGSTELSSTTVTGATFVGTSTLAGAEASEDTHKIEVSVGGVTVGDGVGDKDTLNLSNATLTDQIDVATGGALTIGGEMHLDLTNSDFDWENKSTYAETKAPDDPGKAIEAGGNGFVSRHEVYTVVTGDLTNVDATGADWTVGADAREGVYDKTTGKVTISEPKDTKTYWVNIDAVEVSKASANFADDTTTFKLNGGTLKIDKDTDKAIVTNNENAYKTDSWIALLNGSTLEMKKLTITSGTTVTLSGSADSTLDLGDGYKVDSTKLKGLEDKGAWLGTVKTGAINGGLTPVDISALGNANSTVEADSISGVALKAVTEANTVGTVHVLGDVSLTKGESAVNTMEVDGKLSLGATEESSLDAAVLTVGGAVTMGKGSSITAGTLEAAGIILDDPTVTDDTMGSPVKAGTLTVGESGITINTLSDTVAVTARSLALADDVSSLNITLVGSQIQEAADMAEDMTAPLATLMEVDEDASDIALTLKGVTTEKGSKYGYTLTWNTGDNNTYLLQLTATANENYMKEKFSGGSANGMAGATLMDEAFANGGIGDSGNLKDIMDAVDAENSGMTDDHMAAIAGSSTAALGMAFAGDVERQLRAIRNRTTTMGVNQCVVNEGMPYFNAWVNAEGNMGELDKDGTYAGYKLDSWGGTVGFDVDVNPNLTLGLAVTAMYGDLTVDGPDMLDGDMDTYYVTAFARYSKRAWTHTFIGTVGKMDGSYERTVNHAGGSYTAEGDTDGLAFGLMYEVGRVYALTEDGNTCLQPVFNVAYRHTTVNGYTEKGGNAALDVDDQTLDTITLGAGARMQAVVGENLYNRTSVLELRALAKLDVGDRASEADVAFIGGGSRATVESAELGAFGVELGAGLSIPVGDENDGTIFFDVSAELRSGYSNVNGTVGYRINF